MNEEKVDSCWMKMIFGIINKNHQTIIEKRWLFEWIKRIKFKRENIKKILKNNWILFVVFWLIFMILFHF